MPGRAEGSSRKGRIKLAMAGLGRFEPANRRHSNGRNRRFPAIQACSSLRLAEVTAAFRDGSYAAQGEPRRVQCWSAAASPARL